MAPRESTKTLTTNRIEEVVEEVSQRKRPETGRYLLQVDRQTKGSYPSAELAGKAGLIIKKAHPIVRVTVYDSVDCVSNVIEVA